MLHKATKTPSKQAKKATRSIKAVPKRRIAAARKASAHSDTSPFPPHSQQSFQQHKALKNRQSIHTLKSHLPQNEQQQKFQELAQYLPPKGSPNYTTTRNWISHLMTHKLTVSPDFVAQLGRSVHLIDIRSTEEELLSPVGYIRSANWFPKEDIDKITTSFPKDGLIAVVCSNDTDSRDVVRALKASGHHLAAIVAGGMRSWKLMGFSSSRNPSILQRRSVPISVLYHQEQQRKMIESNKLGQKQMTLDQIIDHLGSGESIQWIKMAAFMVHGRLSCIDGRDDSGIIGTPGGDMGEFIAHCATTEQLLGHPLTNLQISQLFQRRLDAFGRFYMHSDEVSANRLLDKLSAIHPLINDNSRLPGDFVIQDVLSRISKDKMEETLEILTDPDTLGCGHLKFLLTESAAYKVRHGLVKESLKCFFRTRWESGGNGNAECDYVVLSGSHEECGVAHVKVNKDIQPYTKIPLISPSIQNKQIFVNHGQISQYLRHQHSQWFLEQQDILKLSPTAAAAFPALVDLLAEHHAGITVSKLAKDLPMYTLEFNDDHSSCVVHYDGIIGSDPKPAAGEAPHTHSTNCAFNPE